MDVIRDFLFIIKLIFVGQIHFSLGLIKIHFGISGLVAFEA